MSLSGHLLLYKLMILSGGLLLSLLEAEYLKWWATLPMYYKLMLGSPPLIPISVVPTESTLEGVIKYLLFCHS
jgi:hypothetical protein